MQQAPCLRATCTRTCGDAIVLQHRGRTSRSVGWRLWVQQWWEVPAWGSGAT